MLSLREHSLCFAFRICHNKCQKRVFFFLLTLFELERSRLSSENCWSSSLTSFCACVMKSTWQNFSSICKKFLFQRLIQVTQYRQNKQNVTWGCYSWQEEYSWSTLLTSNEKKKTFWHLLYSMKKPLRCFLNVIYIPTVIWAANQDLPKLAVVGGPQLWIIHMLYSLAIYSFSHIETDK